MLANLILSPVQNAINRTYLRRAQHRLRDVQPLVIGITGSYGKTSTKYLLEHLLAGHRRVLKTPLSYNTMMGVCRVINESLEANIEVFIAEMGAYRRGDIKELSDFVHPTIGILTAIGPQHLERFKTIDNIQATKYELIEALPASGVAIFNNDDPRCRALADRTTHVRVMRYGLETTGQSLDLWAEHIAMGPEGLSFTMVSQDGRRVACPHHPPRTPQCPEYPGGILRRPGHRYPSGWIWPRRFRSFPPYRTACNSSTTAAA